MARVSDVAALAALGEGDLRELALIPDYPLDFNIYVFKGISAVRLRAGFDAAAFTRHLSPEQQALLAPANATATVASHDQMLQMLLLERLRRDKMMVETERHRLELRDAAPSAEEVAAAVREYVESNPLLEYQIRSPIHTMLERSSGDSYTPFFERMAQLQLVEFRFEQDPMLPLELIAEFVCPAIREFNQQFVSGAAADADDVAESMGRMSTGENGEPALPDFDQMFQTEIVRVLLPLAAQAVLGGVDLEAAGSAGLGTVGANQ